MFKGRKRPPARPPHPTLITTATPPPQLLLLTLPTGPAESGATLRAILSGLQEELTGGTSELPSGAGGRGSLPPDAPASGSTTTTAAAKAAQASAAAAARQRQQQQQLSRLQLAFCEAVMMLFEREGEPEGAAMFAAAALEHLRASYGWVGVGVWARAGARGKGWRGPGRFAGGGIGKP